MVISDYDGQRFEFDVPLNGPYRPFKRALSYHNFWCFVHWSKFNGDYSAGAVPVESSSETSVSSAWLAHRKGLLKDLHRHKNFEEREEEEEDEELEEFGEVDAFSENGPEDEDLGPWRCMKRKSMA
jgi:hypothetical protein